MRSISFLIVAFIFSLSSVQSSLATTYTFWGTGHNISSPGTADWSASGVWTIDGVNPASTSPGASDTAIVHGSAVLQVTNETEAAAEIELLGNVNGSPQLQLDGNTAFVTVTEIEGDIRNASGVPTIYLLYGNTLKVGTFVDGGVGTGQDGVSVNLIDGGQLYVGADTTSYIHDLSIVENEDFNPSNVIIRAETTLNIYADSLSYIDEYLGGAIYTNSGETLSAITYGSSGSTVYTH